MHYFTLTWLLCYTFYSKGFVFPKESIEMDAFSFMSLVQMWPKSAKKTTSIWGSTLPSLTWEMWRTMYYELTEIICMIWLGTLLLIWHLYKGFLHQKKRPFTFGSLQAVPAQSPEDKDNFPVFWLATNDPPDLCKGNVTSSCYNSNLQLIGNCIIACITRRVFTFKFFLLSLWIYSLCLFVLLPFLPGFMQKRAALSQLMPTLITLSHSCIYWTRLNKKFSKSSRVRSAGGFMPAGSQQRNWREP